MSPILILFGLLAFVSFVLITAGLILRGTTHGKVQPRSAPYAQMLQIFSYKQQKPNLPED